MVNDAIKQLCRDVIVVAAHEVTVEDGIPIGNIETTTEDKKGKDESNFMFMNFVRKTSINFG